MMIETRVRKKRQDLKNNYKTIIGVTLLAFLLWFMVKMNNTYEYDLKVPIRFVNVDEDKAKKLLIQSYKRLSGE